MPDYIEKANGSIIHWLVDKYAVGEGKTACGRTMTNAITGGIIAPLINCQRCKAALRKAGWTV